MILRAFHMKFDEKQNECIGEIFQYIHINNRKSTNSQKVHPPEAVYIQIWISHPHGSTTRPKISLRDSRWPYGRGSNILLIRIYTLVSSRAIGRFPK